MGKRILTAGVILIWTCAHTFAGDLETPRESPGVNWAGVLTQSLAFLGIEHGFRLATEDGTRVTHRPFFGGYVDSLKALHGWSDGDPFYVNYIGHPMQGAVTGFIWVQNDQRFKDAEFGRNRRYWKSRLRATAFSWAYSEQFEIGPISEASIGHIQSFPPQQGFVDQVVTPAIGLAWMIAEDSMDRYIVGKIENHVRNPYVRLLVRGGINPTRSMANVMAGRVPWYRDTRPGVWGTPLLPTSRAQRSGTSAPQAIAPFEFLATTRGDVYLGPNSRGTCIGGGGAAAFRVSPLWQIVGDVSGCKLLNFGAGRSGDSLTYLIGPRWTPNGLKRWQPYVQILAGGRTLTQDESNPVQQTRESQSTGFALSTRAGLDVKLTSAIAIRVADAGYLYSWHSNLDGINYSQTLQLSSGLIVRFGTW